MGVRSGADKTSRLLVLVYAAALLHVTVLAVGWHRVIMSNAVQLLVVMLAVTACWIRGREASDRYLRRAWFQLGCGLTIYTAAQACFTWMLLLHKPIGPRSAAEFVWMLFPFPILLVVSLRRRGNNGQWADWMDAAQACIFYTLLYVLVFSRSAAFSSRLAFELQSLALVLSWLIRFSGTQEGAERRFFGDLGRFLVLYGLLSSLGNRWQQIGLPGYSCVGVCWSVPLLYFSWLVLRAGGARAREPAVEMRPRWNLPKQLHGLSALGLSVLSMAAASELELHHSRAGLCSLVVAFSVFAVRTCVRESQLHVAHDTMAHAVMHDALTGLANRRGLLHELERLLGSGATPADGVALLFLDLDRFKIINDSLGHAMGDRLLGEVSSMLRGTARPGDLVGRLGGDEFVMVLPGLDAAAVQRFADTVVRLFRGAISIDGRVLHVSASVGYAVSRPGAGGEALLRDADSAMYAAKKRGKNQAQFFLGGVQDDAERALRLETDLRAAVGTEQIEVHFQPIYSLKRRRIQGFEALVRWRHPERGLVSPGDFIPLAEETGLILELGMQVLRRGCEQVEQWSRRFGERFTVSVNVSGRQFANPDLLRDVKEILQATALPPELLKLEITESMLLSGAGGVAATLAEARGLGIEISLDDFLTGYSSMSYLLEYPCDVVKIDRSFVRSVDKDPRRAELVRTVVQLAENLGMSVIAEGVETEAEMALLGQVGCDCIQGYLFSRPLPPSQVEALLEGEGSWGCPVEREAGVGCHEFVETTPGFA